MAIKQKITYLLGLLILLLLVILPFSVSAFQRGGTKADVIYKIDANNKKANFSARIPIKYKVSLDVKIPEEAEA